ncbi:MAG TPA: hypothetical protein VH083_08460 [Myxococcales bacterium]|jgi:hypothetical protein|nr:hypothetical protein [Myxococcales bacterium]
MKQISVKCFDGTTVIYPKELNDMLFHVTLAKNLSSIVATRQLESASRLVQRVGASKALLRCVRDTSSEVAPGITLNDQRPMRGWKKDGLAEYLEYLNQHVYFWQWSPLESYSGNQQRRNPSIRHAAMYGGRYFSPTAPSWDRVLLRFGQKELEAMNISKGPSFSICNSGAPDHNSDLLDLRTRVFSGTRSTGVEIVFRDIVLLPESAEIWNRQTALWIRLVRVDSVEHFTTVNRG